MRQQKSFFHKTIRCFSTLLLTVILAVPLGASARTDWSASPYDAFSIGGVCPYDATGHYLYLPVFLFYGDGQITKTDSDRFWYRDDVATCYETHLTPGYLKYFPKCDIDGDDTVTMSEVYDIYYRVHPQNQNDTVAAAACMDAFEGEPFFYCSSEAYDRTVNDINEIKYRYPATEAIYETQGMTAGQLPKLHSYLDLTCTTSTGTFSTSAFRALNECYLASSQCGPDCSTVNISFSQPTNTLKTVDEYNAVAASFGGSCSRVVGNTYDGAAPGFHYTADEIGAEEWNWQVRTTAECLGNHCECDITYEFATNSENLGSVYLISETNNTSALCTDARFPSGLCTGDPATGDSDGDGVCDDQDQCLGNDLYGDVNPADGICDEFQCHADMPPFYDQFGSAVERDAGGTCVETEGFAGPPACPQADWQNHVDDINWGLANYDFTNAIYDANSGGLQSWAKDPWLFVCVGMPYGMNHRGIFDDLNACYQADNDWRFDGSFNFVTFNWGVNVWEAVNIYNDRLVSAYGPDALCELSSLSGSPTGFHATNSSYPWRQWEARATEDCDYHGCRCDATASWWTNTETGEHFEDAVVNDSGPRGLPGQQTNCTDSRFYF